MPVYLLCRFFHDIDWRNGFEKENILICVDREFDCNWCVALWKNKCRKPS